MKSFVLYILLALLLSACSDSFETVGTISIPSASRDTLILRETIIHLNEGDVVEVWNDMLIQTLRKDDVEVSYGLEQFVHGKSRGGLKIDALKTNPTIVSVDERARGRLVKGFQGKMTYIEINETADYTFKAILKSNDSLLIIDRAKLVFKRIVK